MYPKRLILLFHGGAAIYGSAWDGLAPPTLTRTDSAIGKVANAGVDAVPVINDFDNIYPWSEMREVTDGLGNTFVRIPKFYIEKTATGVRRTWRISKLPFGKCYTPACFQNSAYVDVGKYDASKAAAVLQSVSGAYPLVSDTIVNFRSYAQANGAGYYQMDIHVADLIRTLFYVEFATLNSQSVMAGATSNRYNAADVVTAETSPAANTLVVANATGANFLVGQSIGCGTSLGGNQRFAYRKITAIDADTPGAGSTTITFDGAAAETFVDDIIYTTAWITGATDSVVASSGSLTNNTNGLYPCKYRGIENPWGNIYKFVDGVNINENQAWICRTPADYASNVFAAPYEQLSYVCLNANGYPVAMGFDGDRPMAELPITGGGGSTTYYSDYYYQNTGQRIALLGGYWFNGSPAGLSGWVLINASSSASVIIGGRLLKAGA